MTQLYIDGHICDLPTDFKFTLVTENLYFSKASTYTYDVKLPMLPFSNNAKIFGHLNRFDKSLSTRSWPAQLIVDNKVIVNGTAVVVGITDDSISVQLLQGNSELNWKQRYEKTYIDELDLGTAAEWGLQRTVLGADEQPTIAPIDSLATTVPNGTKKMFKVADVEAYNNGNVLFTPIKNRETDTKMNNIRVVGGNVYLSKADVVKIDESGILYPARTVPQPKFSLMFNKVLTALGLTITVNELADNVLYNNLFVANSTSLWNVAEILPHLTVVDFIEQVQVLFDCFIVINNDNTVEIYLRRNCYGSSNAENLLIERVVDEYNVDVDNEAAEINNDKAKVYDISYEDFGKDFLGHEFDSVPIVTADQLPASPTENPNVFAINPQGHKVSSPYINGSNKIAGQPIDHFQIWPADTNDEFTLKFVPVYGEYLTHTRYHIQNGNNDVVWELYYYANQAIGMMTIEDTETTVQDILDENGTLPEKQYTETLCLGFPAQASMVFPGGSYQYKYLTAFRKTASTTPADNWDGDQTAINVAAQTYDLSLMPLKDENNNKIKNLNSQFYEQSTPIETAHTYVVTFVTDQMFDAKQQFLIKNQLFACKQIKYTITARGFEKIAEGEFYKL